MPIDRLAAGDPLDVGEQNRLIDQVNANSDPAGLGKVQYGPWGSFNGGSQHTQLQLFEITEAVQWPDSPSDPDVPWTANCQRLFWLPADDDYDKHSSNGETLYLVTVTAADSHTPLAVGDRAWATYNRQSGRWEVISGTPGAVMHGKMTSAAGGKWVDGAVPYGMFQRCDYDGGNTTGDAFEIDLPRSNGNDPHVFEGDVVSFMLTEAGRPSAVGDYTDMWIDFVGMYNGTAAAWATLASTTKKGWQVWTPMIDGTTGRYPKHIDDGEDPGEQTGAATHTHTAHGDHSPAAHTIGPHEEHQHYPGEVGTSVDEVGADAGSGTGNTANASAGDAHTHPVSIGYGEYWFDAPSGDDFQIDGSSSLVAHRDHDDTGLGHAALSHTYNHSAEPHAPLTTAVIFIERFQ